MKAVRAQVLVVCFKTNGKIILFSSCLSHRCHIDVNNMLDDMDFRICISENVGLVFGIVSDK
jgi:hypothetical protein